jgi:hypothetical protein
LACIIGGFFFLWGFILFWLKLHRNSVGCAAGRSFQPEFCTHFNEVHGEHEVSDAGDSDDDESRCSLSQEERMIQSGSRPLNYAFEDTSSRSSAGDFLPSEDKEEEDSLSSRSKTIVDECSADGTEVRKPSRRERRTQTIFLLFGLATLVCVPLTIILCFRPVAVSTKSLDVHISDSQTIIDEIDTALGTISNASDSAVNLLKTMSLDFNELCPGDASSGEIEAILGVDVDTMLQLFAADYTELARQVSQNISDVSQFVEYFEDAVQVAEKGNKETETYLWIILGILLALTGLTAVAMFGVLFAWKRRSTKRFQRILSYVALPGLVVMSIMSWVLAIAAAVSTAVGGDACTSGSSSGGPNETIMEVLAASNFSMNGTIYEMMSIYTGDCHSGDPTEELSALSGEVLSATSNVTQYLYAIESVGLTNIEGYCGEGESFGAFLAGSRDIVKFLTSIQKSLDDVTVSLSCSRINSLYNEAINDALCTDVASAAAWGLVFFFCIGIATMAMITLRSSWRHKIDEEKIYDESEVAENMIVDEHEEYLLYIAKYKHEWEEYQGLSEQRVQSGSTGTLYHSTSESAPSTSSGVGSGESPEVPFGQGGTPLHQEIEPFDPYNTTDNTSQSTADISFLSLKDLQTPSTGETTEIRDLLNIPPPLLQPRISDQESPGLDGDRSIASKIGSETFSLPPAISVSPETVPSTDLKQDTGESESQSLEDDGRQISSLGRVFRLSSPPKRDSRTSLSPSNPGSVKFQLDAEAPSSYVQQQVDRFSKQSRTNRPSTPTRLQPEKMKDLAAKFDSPAAPSTTK